MQLFLLIFLFFIYVNQIKAIFEAQEETIAHLKMQITAKNDLILSLQQQLREELQEKEQLKKLLK